MIGQITRVGVASEQAGRRLSFLATGYNEVAGAAASVARVSAVLQTSTLKTEQAFSKFYGSLRPAGIELAEIETIYVGIAKAGRLAGAGTSELQAGLLQVKQAFASGRWLVMSCAVFWRTCQRLALKLLRPTTS